MATESQEALPAEPWSEHFRAHLPILKASLALISHKYNALIINHVSILSKDPSFCPERFEVLDPTMPEIAGHCTSNGAIAVPARVGSSVEEG